LDDNFLPFMLGTDVLTLTFFLSYVHDIGVFCMTQWQTHEKNMRGTREHMLWFLNFGLKTFWNIKKLDKNISAYVSIFYVLTKSFQEKPTFFVLCVKRQKLVLKMALYETFFVFSTQATKSCQFFTQLGVQT
jgi:hypothetical protein